MNFMQAASGKNGCITEALFTAAMLTAFGADFVAAPPGIPGLTSPFYLRSQSRLQASGAQEIVPDDVVVKVQPTKYPQMKTHHCPDCRQTKPLTPAFWYHNKYTRSGYAVYCKPCQDLRNDGEYVRRVHTGTARVLARIASDQKLCKRCGRLQSLSRDFGKCARSADRHTWACRDCTREMTRDAKKAAEAGRLFH